MSGIYKKGGNVSVFGKRKLRKIQLDKWIGGVCAGVAYWIGAPTWFVRFVWFLIFWISIPLPFLLYILLWIFMPRWKTDPLDYEKVTAD